LPACEPQAEVYQAEQLLKETMEAKKALSLVGWREFIDVTGLFLDSWIVRYVLVSVLQFDTQPSIFKLALV